MTSIIYLIKPSLGTKSTSTHQLAFVLRWTIIIEGFIFILLGIGWFVRKLKVVMLVGWSFVDAIGLFVGFVCGGG